MPFAQIAKKIRAAADDVTKYPYKMIYQGARRLNQDRKRRRADQEFRVIKSVRITKARRKANMNK